VHLAVGGWKHSPERGARLLEGTGLLSGKNVTPPPAPKRTQVRLFPRDGSPAWKSAEIIGWKPDFSHDAYYFLISTRWPFLLLCFMGVFLGANALFGELYALSGGVLSARPGSFVDGFFFSVETMGTIGYGEMTPRSGVAHLLVTIESMFSMLFLAVVTGLVFAKFSRPRARVAFSQVAVVAPRNGVPTLMFRVANERANHIVEAQLRVVVMSNEVTLEGEKLRRMQDIALLRDRSSAFILTWTAMHVLNEQSPLYGATRALLEERQAEVLVTFTGYDATLAQTIHARYSYIADEVLFGHRFLDIISVLPDGTRRIDFNRFHETEPLLPKPPAA
jgi:inward rectifier potassium channel